VSHVSKRGTTGETDDSRLLMRTFKFKNVFLVCRIFVTSEQKGHVWVNRRFVVTPFVEFVSHVQKKGHAWVNRRLPVDA